MKRYTFFLTAIFIAFFGSAQNQHLTFMGFPLNGTINSFQQKLATKGVKPDPNAINNESKRWFIGKFAGYDADICVSYEPNTKTVYRATACIRRPTYFNDSEEIYRILESLLIKKYPNCKKIYPSLIPPELKILTPLGEIYLYRGTSFSRERLSETVIYVDYCDRANFNKFDRRSDDL